MPKLFDDVVTESKELKDSYAGCSAMWDDMEAQYFIRPKTNPKIGEHGKITLSPDPHNKIMGAIRLMVATDPAPMVTKTDDITQDQCDRIEAFCSAMWAASGHTSGTPPHYDLITSGLLYGTATVGVVSMKKMAELAAGKPTEKLAKQVAAQTPYLFESWNPRTCYARQGRLGLTGHLRRVETTAGVVIEDWGKEGEVAVGGGSRAKKVTLCEWWDLEYHTVWLEGGGTPILHEPHNMSFIPIATTLAEGSSALFPKPVQSLMPFLYAVAKSGLWERQNLGLSWLYTMIYAIGANPMFVYKRNQKGKEIDVDWDKAGGIVGLDPGEDFGPLMKQVIDPSLMQGITIADEKVMESTMYPQALGQSLTGNAPYSTIALLSQSGRLPLVSPQKRLGWLIARAMWLALQWTKEPGEGGKRTAIAGKYSTFDTADLPETVDLQAQLEIALPQDKLQLANVATTLKQAGILSDQWIRQNVLSISQDKQMTRQIWKEQYFQLQSQQFAQQQMQAAQQPQLPAGMPPNAPGTPTTGAPENQGITPAGPGIPPELAAGGTQGPEALAGQGPVPGGV